MSHSMFLLDPARPVLSQVMASLVDAAMAGSQPAGRRTELRIDAGSRLAFLEYYDDWCRLLEAEVAGDQAVLVWYLSSDGREDGNVLPPDPTYGRLCAMLALTFPDVMFVRVSDWDDVASGAEARLAGVSPLFDALGHRDAIRRSIRSDPQAGADTTYLPARSDVAVAIDDEDAYALLHAYSAYRFGFRAVPVSTRTSGDFVLSNSGGRTLPLGQPRLTLEDLFLRFPDGSESYSDLRRRQDRWGGLSWAKQRIFITSGFRQRHDVLKIKDNASFVKRERAAGKHLRTLNKPHAGIFRIWQDAGLFDQLGWKDNCGVFRHGVAAGFAWPPTNQELSGVPASHSADGTLGLISHRLAERAERLRAKDGLSTLDAIRGAVFSTDALELLGGRTPTSAIDVLRLKHEFEVTAECRFSGVEHHIRLTPRLDEIRRDVEVICMWFHPDHRRNAGLNAEMNILSRLTLVFKNHAQFDEEQACLIRIRSIENELWRRQRPLRRLAWPIQWYLEQLLTSVPRFAAWIAVWIVILALVYSTEFPSSSLSSGLLSSVSSFFSVGSPVGIGDAVANTSLFHGTLVTISIVFGFFHLGVFISHLYSIASRR